CRVRGHHPQHAPLGRARHGHHRLAAHGPGVLPGRVQAAPRVQLGDRNPAAADHVAALLLRLPAALGSAGHLGYHGGHQHGQVRTHRRPLHALPAARWQPGGPGCAHTLLRLTCDRLTPDRLLTHGRTLLARPKRRVHRRPVMATVERPAGAARGVRVSTGPELATPPLVVRRREEEETVVTFPTLVWREFLAGLAMFVFLMAVSIQVNAPLLQKANTSITPNPAKAPWYFVGLQELLERFPPIMAGVAFPTFVIVFMMLTPYLDKNPSRRPQDRKVAITMFTIYLCLAVAFVLIGALMRGQAFNFDPWLLTGHPDLRSPT